MKTNKIKGHWTCTDNSLDADERALVEKDMKIKTAHIAEIFRKYPDASNSKIAEEINKIINHD